MTCRQGGEKTYLRPRPAIGAKMKKNTISRYFKDKEYRTIVAAFFSFVISLAFAVYNGYLGLRLGSVWNGGVCVYYLLLMSVRGIIVYTEKKNRSAESIIKTTKRRKTFILTSVLLFVINLALITPVAMMAMFKKEVNMGTIPAIAMAAYTTYKIIAASVNYSKYRKHDNLSVRQIRHIGLIDALVSVLTLQNTLITVNGNGSVSEKIFILSAVTSGVVIGLILAINVINLTQGLKASDGDKQKKKTQG